MKKLFLVIALLLSTKCFGQFQSDLILTSKDAAWTDSRAYSSLSLAIASIGVNERTLVIAKQEIVTDLTIPSNITLEFRKNGSIANSGTLTIQTKNIIAPNRQIFTGSGEISFASGSVIKSGWFSNFESALALTTSDSVTLVVSKPQTITASFAVGNNVILKWESPGNILTINTSKTISNIKSIEAGDYQILAGSGTYSFVDGFNANLRWFNSFRSAITWIGSTKVTLYIPSVYVVDLSDSTNANTILDFNKLNGSLSINAGITITINSYINAVDNKIFLGLGTVILGSNIHVIYPSWFGAYGDGLTDDSTKISATINAATVGSIIKFPRQYRLDTTVSLKSGIIYDLTGGIFYPGTSLTSMMMFSGVSVNNIEIIGGTFDDAAYSPTIVEPSGLGTYTAGFPFYFNDASNVKVHGMKVLDPLWFGIDVYDSSYIDIYNNYFYNNNAAIAVVANTKDSVNVKIHHNTIIGPGDDGIAVLNQTGVGNIRSVEISFNQLDKTRWVGIHNTATNIRVGGAYGGGTGKIYSPIISNNLVKNGCAQGLYLHDIEGGVISGNIIDGYSQNSTATPAITFGVTGHGVNNVQVIGNIVKTPGQLSAPAIVSQDSNYNNFIGGEYSGSSVAGSYNITFENSKNNSFGGSFRASNATATGRVLYLDSNSTGNSISSDCIFTVTDSTPVFLLVPPVNLGLELPYMLATYSFSGSTPSVLNSQNFITANGSPTSITNFIDGYEGKNIKIIIGDSNTTLDFTGSNLLGNGNVDYKALANDVINCTKVGSYWYCTINGRQNYWGSQPTVSDGANISHGYTSAPSAVLCTTSIAGDICSVTAISATTFTISIKKHDGTPGTIQTIYWAAFK